jgi:alanine-synthesizing transaminase
MENDQRTVKHDIHFSKRTNWDSQESELARALSERRLQGRPIYDLTASNPTQCGFDYDQAAILAPLSAPGSLIYEPNPRGMLPPRAAVAEYYRQHGAPVPTEQLFLTTSTSEAYSYLFRLLCDPGDEVLIAQPSYPLFDFLATLDDVRLTPYPLIYDHGWQIDLHALRQCITPHTRAIAVVHPNNPTGHFTRAAERAALESLAVEHGLALIVDEVFLDYPLGVAGQTFAAGPHAALTFVLSGLSKVAALPQMKSAWIACFGPPSEAADDLSGALARLEIIADTFLSVNAPIQNATPVWLAGRGPMQIQIDARVRANLLTLDRLLATQTLVTRLAVEAGWYAVLRVPAIRSGETAAIELLRDHGVSFHPGYFFGFPGDGYMVISLLSMPEEFAEGINNIMIYFNKLQSASHA